jgi:hypothetical protein
MIAHTESCLAILNTLFSDPKPLFVSIPHRLTRLDVVPIFIDAMQPLDPGLTPHNEISRLTLLQPHRVGYRDFCYFGSFCWTLVLLGDFLA